MNRRKVQTEKTKKKTYTLKKSMTSGDNGEAPDPIKRTRPPSFSFILLKTSLSQNADGFRPEDSTHEKERTNAESLKQVYLVHFLTVSISRQYHL